MHGAGFRRNTEYKAQTVWNGNAMTRSQESCTKSTERKREDMAGMGALGLGVSVLLWFERFCCFAGYLFFLPCPWLLLWLSFCFLFTPIFHSSNTSFPFGHSGMAVRWRGYGWRYFSVCILLVLYVPHSPSSI
ncbi:hypothetical protein BDQ94DRAFT_137354 [Aspergillus welwitschiae]|uniref:Uncharacterized protein n=1 Tax=Aspergillus welwitschiae TaxID=1341132 RepID=A0A3F3QCQ4_9EURO|nr:hypothetical protein BDQ94DRAFT_137354 [Aspergillus welwitschiae]RDH37044.1 hypothetical protein BDQ94DRAFT_137354 [Aspergillus welwitschiae]